MATIFVPTIECFFFRQFRETIVVHDSEYEDSDLDVFCEEYEPISDLDSESSKTVSSDEENESSVSQSFESLRKATQLFLELKATKKINRFFCYTSSVRRINSYTSMTVIVTNGKILPREIQ